MTNPDLTSWLRERAVPIVAVLVLVVGVLLFRVELVEWFTGKADGAEPDAGGHDHAAMLAGASKGDEPPAAPSYDPPPPALDAMMRALSAYERLRDAFARDTVAGTPDDARSLAAALRDARAADSGAPGGITDHLDAAAKAADAISRAPDLAAARAGFQAVSEHLVAVAAASPKLSEGLHVFQCPMTEGFNKWVQPSPQISNPFQGQNMLTCGSEIDFAAAGTGAHEEAYDPDEIAYYTCPMDTWVKAREPGKCPVCGMDLTPVTKEAVRTGILQIDHRRRQLIGLRIGEVVTRPVALKIRAVGKVVYDESRLADVSLKYGGWIEKLMVDTTGQKVRKGQTLFTVYSPDLYSAQQEYLLALRQKQTARDDAGRARAEALLRGARERLRLWDITDKQVAQLADSGEPRRYIPIQSPAHGYVVAKNVVEGAAFKPGEQLFRVAGLDKVWVEAEVYEQDIGYVGEGQEAKVSMSHLPGVSFPGKVSFIYPYLDKMSRTARVRIILDNPGLELKPDMFANVDISVDLGERLMVPESAIIYSGPRRIVFLDIGNDKLRPQVIEVGVRSDSYYEVRSGLSEGDKVVISGNFLISSESRLKSATGLW